MKLFWDEQALEQLKYVGFESLYGSIRPAIVRPFKIIQKHYRQQVE